MQKFLLVTSLLLSFSVIACECSEYPLDHGDAIVEYVKKNFDETVEADSSAVIWTAYYPSIEERITARSYRGTSCEGTGPRGELMFHCARSRNSDYRVLLAKKGCQITLKVKSGYKNISAKLLSSTCTL